MDTLDKKWIHILRRMEPDIWRLHHNARCDDRKAMWSVSIMVRMVEKQT